MLILLLAPPVDPPLVADRLGIGLRLVDSVPTVTVDMLGVTGETKVSLVSVEGTGSSEVRDATGCPRVPDMPVRRKKGEYSV